jgi:hypothetical protein
MVGQGGDVDCGRPVIFEMEARPLYHRRERVLDDEAWKWRCSRLDTVCIMFFSYFMRLQDLWKIIISSAKLHGIA